MKKIKQIILLFIFTFVLSTNVSFADNIEVDINKVGTKLGEEFIDTEINNEESGFDNSSKINKIKSTYGQPVVLGINGFKNSDYGWHAVLGVGGEINQYGSYYRICDGWSRSLSKFISSSHIGDSWYYRWN